MFGSAKFHAAFDCHRSAAGVVKAETAHLGFARLAIYKRQPAKPHALQHLGVEPNDATRWPPVDFRSNSLA
jgi:hypothetical protein